MITKMVIRMSLCSTSPRVRGRSRFLTARYPRRRRVVRRWRKPLVVMTPKSLLRHPKVVSSLDDCAQGHFRRVLPDALRGPPERVRRILLCTGKIYYELEKQRETAAPEEIAIVRL